MSPELSPLKKPHASADSRSVSILSPRSYQPSPRARTRGRGATLPGTLLKVTLVGALVVVPAVEAGSWFITRMQLDGDASTAAREAAYAVHGLPTTAATAQDAFDVSVRVLDEAGGDSIDPATFRLFDDGTVRLTAARTAPSVLLGHLDWTRDLMQVQATVEATPVD